MTSISSNAVNNTIPNIANFTTKTVPSGRRGQMHGVAYPPSTVVARVLVAGASQTPSDRGGVCGRAESFKQWSKAQRGRKGPYLWDSDGRDGMVRTDGNGHGGRVQE